MIPLDDIKLQGYIERINKSYEPKETERLFYHIGEYKNSVKGNYYDKKEQRWYKVHKWVDWQYSSQWNEVSIDWWNKYSNDDNVTEEEIEHHRFIVLKANE